MSPTTRSQRAPGHPLEDKIDADDIWSYVRFARENPAAKPILVRVNGVTKSASIEQAF